MLAPTSMMVIYSKLGRDRRPRLSVKKHWQTTGGCLYMHDEFQSLLLWEKVAAARLTDEELSAQAIFPSPHEKKDQKQKYQILLPLLLRDK